MRHQRLTIYEDDDLTPWRVFSNAPLDALPYLIAPDEGPEMQVDMLKGEATLSLVSIEVGDVALVAGDQDGGAFTDSLAVGGETAYVGRRALWEIEDGLGGWTRRLDGVAGAPALNPDLSSYTLPLRNTIERARKASAFETAVERDGSGDIVQAPVVMPAGVYADYGTTGSILTRPVVQPSVIGNLYNPPPVGRYVAASKTVQWLGLYWSRPNRNIQAHAPQEVAGRGEPLYDSTGAYLGMFAQKVSVLWRASGTANPWNEITSIAVPQSDPNVFHFGEGNFGQTVVDIIQYVRLDGTGTLPTDGQSVEIMVVYTGEPTEHYPRYLQGTVGALLKAGYDGEWGDPPRVKYNAVRMAEMVANTPHIHMRVKTPVKDLREWMQKELYKPFGYAPGLNEANEIYPISQELPDPSVALVTLDDTNTEDAEWTHDDGASVNVVEFEVITERRSTAPFSDLGDGIIEDTSKHVFIHAPSLAILGEQKEEYEQASLRGSWGMRQAVARKNAIFDRFPWGPQRVRAIISASVGLSMGQWATCGWSWLPDYQTNRRGMSRLMQVVRLKDLDPNFVEAVLEDAGATNTPLVAPTLGTVTQLDGVVTVPVATIPAGDARVDYAVVAEGGPIPDSNSGEWLYGGRVSLPGDVILPAQDERVDVLARARAESELRRPSAYSAIQRITATPAPGFSSVTAEYDPDTGTVTVRWAAHAGTLGVRLFYDAHQADATPDLAGAFVDVDASLGEYVFPASVVASEVFSVGLVPYSGFALGSVTGTSGVQVPRSIATPQAGAHQILRWEPAYTDPTGDTVPYEGEIGAAVSHVLLYQLVRAQGDPSPWSTIESVGSTTQLTPSGRDISHTYTVPDEGDLRYFRLRPVTVAGGQVTLGNAVDGIVYPKGAQAPVANIRWTDNGVTLTAWLELQDRGIPVTAVKGLAQIANGPIITSATPTRGPGDASTYAGGTLASGQYEQDAVLDSYRTTRVGFEVTLLTGEVLTFWSPAHDRNRLPEFVVAPRVEGTVVSVEGDSDTISFLMEHVGGSWSMGVDDWTGAIDVALADDAANPGIPTDTQWVIRITLHSDPLADVDVDTLTQVREVTVTNGTPTSVVLETPVVDVPAVDSDVATVTLEADSAPAGHYMLLKMRTQVAGEAWSDRVDVTGDLTPALSAPPTTPTAYTLPTGHTRLAKTSATQPIVSVEITGEVYDVGDNLITKATRTRNWFVAEAQV